jgi:hypothetical protein
MPRRPRRVRQNNTTGKSLLITINQKSSPKLKNISVYQNIKLAYLTSIPFLSEGRIMTVTKRGMGRGGRDSALDERG